MYVQVSKKHIPLYSVQNYCLVRQKCDGNFAVILLHYSSQHICTACTDEWRVLPNIHPFIECLLFIFVGKLSIENEYLITFLKGESNLSSGSWEVT